MGTFDEECQRFAHGHFQNVVNIFAVVADFQDAGFEALAAALLADQLDIGEELHFDGDGAVALAGFAAAAGHVERKMAGGIAAALGVGRVGKNFADGVEGLQVSGRIRARRAADGRLVDDDDFVDVFVAFEAVAEFLDAARLRLASSAR